MKLADNVKDILEEIDVDVENDSSTVIMDKLMKRLDSMSVQKKLKFWQKLSEAMINLFMESAPSAETKYNRFLKKFYREVFKQIQGD